MGTHFNRFDPGLAIGPLFGSAGFLVRAAVVLLVVHGKLSFDSIVNFVQNKKRN